MKTVVKEWYDEATKIQYKPIKVDFLPKSTKIRFMHISYDEIVYNSLSWFEKLRLNFFVKVVLPHSVLTIEKHK